MNGVNPGEPWSLLRFDDMNTAEIEAFKLSSPVPAPPVQTDDADTAYTLVLADAGATFPVRDSADERIVDSVINGTGQVIDCVDGNDFYFRTGYAQAATSNTITLEYDDQEDDGRYTGMDIEILSGTGIGQIRTVSDYDNVTDTATLSSNWTTVPDVTSEVCDNC